MNDNKMKENIYKELVDVVPSIRKGMSFSFTLLVISFFFGFLMILLSAYLIIWTDVELVIKLMFGGAGIANTFGALLYYPIEKIQLLKGRLAVYQAAYISWLSNMFISEAVIQDLHAGTSKLSVDDCIKLSESSTKTIKELLILINPKSDIDKLSKLYNAKTHKK